MTGEMIYSSLSYGGLVRTSSAGGSVERASAPRVSITKLTQSI